MIIDTLTLRNFRLFEELSLSLGDRMSVVVGTNGSGKSSILDAMVILLSCYVGGFDGIGVRRIAQKDIRHVTRQTGSTFENIPQLPVEIEATGAIGSEGVSWGSTKASNSASSHATSAYAQMTRLAKYYQDQLWSGDSDLLLPVVAHYGTGRLWKQAPKSRKLDTRLKKTFGRLSAYDDCLDARLTDTILSTWFERMTYKSLQSGEDIPEFRAVRDAIEHGLKTLSDISELSVESNLDTHELDVLFGANETHAAERIPSSQLSDGYRVALNLFADIAYRAATLNPQLGHAVLAETEGIVLVDEIDLHLHPQWQQLILTDLMDIFPKMQFVVTTHAPAVISSVSNGQLIVVDGSHAYSSDSGFYGKDANTILREVMGVTERPRAVKNLFEMFYRLVDEENFDEAEDVLERLRDILGGDDVEVAGCSVQLDLERMELV